MAQNLSNLTTYPAVDRFVAAFGPCDLLVALQQRRNRAVVGGCPPLVLHVALGGRRAELDRTLAALEREMALAAAALGSARGVARVHLELGAAGWPGDARAVRLMDALHAAFLVPPAAGLRVDVGARCPTAGELSRWRSLGCDELVFEADARRDAARAAAAARRAGIATVCVRLAADEDGLDAALSALVGARPDRIALDDARLGHVARARAAELLEAARYVPLGLQTFAQPRDRLALARAQGRLFLGPDGFGDLASHDLLALGAGAVGQVGATYYQNHADAGAHAAALEAGRLPVARGIALGRDDLARRAVIQALVCQGRMDFEAIGLAHLLDARSYFAQELEEMGRWVRTGLAAMDAESIELTPAGRRVAGEIAGVFDRFQRAQRRRNQCASLL